MRAAAIEQIVSKGDWLTAVDFSGQTGDDAHPEPIVRWKEEDRIFAVHYEGKIVFAPYQFDENMQPRAVIAQVLDLFKHKKDQWKIAAWFASANGWLRGRRPQDCLDDPASVIEAARREVAGIDAQKRQGLFRDAPRSRVIPRTI